MNASDAPQLPMGTKTIVLFLLHGRRHQDTHGLLLASRLGISPSAAYRHLHDLVDDGLAVSAMEEPGVVVARALQRQYRITEAGIEAVRMICLLAGIRVPQEEA